MTQANLAEHIQSFDLGAILNLYTLDCRIVGGPMLRFTETTDGGSPAQAIVFQGQTYAPVPVEAEGWQASHNGAAPRPIIRVSNVNSAVSALLNEFPDILGSTVTRLRTFDKFLDGMPTADPLAHYAPDVYRVERISSKNPIYVEFTLASSLDQQGVMLPGRQISQTVCGFRYRRWDAQAGGFDYSSATCPYAGGAAFDANGNPTTPERDFCSKNLKSGCKKRYPHDPLPFAGFPGVGRTSR